MSIIVRESCLIHLCVYKITQIMIYGMRMCLYHHYNTYNTLYLAKCRGIVYSHQQITIRAKYIIRTKYSWQKEKEICNSKMFTCNHASLYIAHLL